MLTSMAYTQSQLDAIKTAIASGTLTVTHNGRSITYRSTQDLLAVKREIESELNASSTTRMKPRYQQARFDD